MQEGNDRLKRRRLNGNEDNLPFPQQHMLQAAAGAEASNADPLAQLLLRQRLMAAEQQQQQQQLHADSTGYAGSMALARAGAGGEASLLGAGLPGAGGADPMMAHLRHNLVNQQLQQAARLQAITGGDDLSYLRASEAASQHSSSSLYASLLGSTGSHQIPRNPFANSLLLEQALGNDAAGSAVSGVSLADQLSQRGGSGARRAYMQSLLEAEREEAAAAAAAEGTGGAGNFRQLLALNSAAAESSGQASLLARLQNERALATAAMGGAPGPFTPAGLQSLISRAPVGTVTGAGLNRDLLLARGGAGGYLGMSMPGAAAAGAGAGGMPRGNAMQAKKRPAPVSNPNTTGRQPIHLFMSCDMDDLSPYQCLVRKQIELFEAQDIDAETNARGRNRPIVVGQVGIRCKHCKMLPPRKRERAAIYYPSKLDRLYQAGQTMASVHLGQHCNHIPEHLRQELARLREGKSAALAGKKYWSDGARALGVIEEDERLFFKRE